LRDETSCGFNGKLDCANSSFSFAFESKVSGQSWFISFQSYIARLEKRPNYWMSCSERNKLSMLEIAVWHPNNFFISCKKIVILKGLKFIWHDATRCNLTYYSTLVWQKKNIFFYSSSMVPPRNTISITCIDKYLTCLVLCLA
jgi:hypothetical protein